MRPDLSRQAGSAPLSLVLGLGLLLVPLLLIVLSIPTWEARTVDARDAASLAARVLVTSSTWGDGVVAARNAIAEVGTNDGISPDQIRSAFDGSLARGSTVRVEVTVVIPATQIPLVGAVGSLHYTATSYEMVDQYRSLG